MNYLLGAGLVLATGISAQGQYADGDGSAEFSFQIAEPNQLIYMSEHPEHWSKHFILTADINMNLAEPNTFTIALIAPDTSSFEGFQGTRFTSVFDGNDIIISNLTIDTSGAGNDYLGLFGLTEGSNAEIKNLGLKNVSITGGIESYYLGGLCGYNYEGTISKCYSTGSISGDTSLSGLCGINDYSDISNCYSTVSQLPHLQYGT